MPIYEYTCNDCHRLTSVFSKSMSAKVKAACQHCGGKKMSRAVSRFATPRTEQQVLQNYGSEPQTLEDYKDPRQIGRWAERKFDEYGMELPDAARKMIDAAREGDLPSPIDEL